MHECERRADGRQRKWERINFCSLIVPFARRCCVAAVMCTSTLAHTLLLRSSLGAWKRRNCWFCTQILLHIMCGVHTPHAVRSHSHASEIGQKLFIHSSAFWFVSLGIDAHFIHSEEFSFVSLPLCYYYYFCVFCFCPLYTRELL